MMRANAPAMGLTDILVMLPTGTVLGGPTLCATLMVLVAGQRVAATMVPLALVPFAAGVAAVYFWPII